MRDYLYVSTIMPVLGCFWLAAGVGVTCRFAADLFLGRKDE